LIAPRPRSYPKIDRVDFYLDEIYIQISMLWRG